VLLSASALPCLTLSTMSTSEVAVLPHSLGRMLSLPRRGLTLVPPVTLATDSLACAHPTWRLWGALLDGVGDRNSLLLAAWLLLNVSKGRQYLMLAVMFVEYILRLTFGGEALTWQ
jgi:hypothetical protein